MPLYCRRNNPASGWQPRILSHAIRGAARNAVACSVVKVTTNETRPPKESCVADRHPMLNFCCCAVLLLLLLLLRGERCSRPQTTRRREHRKNFYGRWVEVMSIALRGEGSGTLWCYDAGGSIVSGENYAHKGGQAHNTLQAGLQFFAVFCTYSSVE